MHNGETKALYSFEFINAFSLDEMGSTIRIERVVFSEILLPAVIMKYIKNNVNGLLVSVVCKLVYTLEM